MNEKQELVRLKTYCPSCSSKTNHEVLESYENSYSPDNTPEMGIDFATGTWQIVRCMGCEDVSFRQYWLTSEDYHPELGPEGTEYRYPKVGPDDLLEQRYRSLPAKIRGIYYEIIETYNLGLSIACASLVRSIIEGIANECAELFDLPDILEVPKGKGKIEHKISRLVFHGILSKSNGDILHESRVLGNLAIHELVEPKQKELKYLIEIIEHTIYGVFEISEKLDELKWKRALKKKKDK